ncbi:DUF3285 domain-containing protein [Chamaesiphon polymorphus]|uniref:DUF3285 domain-containing protein n=1 Tax=Chamaesiphon polymorphus CCALA 037 TaxID=2107692 RepID=A0A2T1GHV9_9CYAN|nr:DUF3285 domain-containing protein [Chamaesiphon polymorphus]PSB57310.1 DUF3285 domain-containing protein [Chamaesiphon polymorphus CCALA 037]
MTDTPIDNNPTESTAVIQSPSDLNLATSTATLEVPPTPEELKTKYVKYAMRNMVKKRGKSLQHFALSTIGLLALFVGLAYLTR